MLPSPLSRLFSRVLAGACLALALVSGEAPAQDFTEEHVVLVIDRSGSMQTVRASGLTRFAEAMVRANDFVNLQGGLPQLFAVWTFEGSSYIREQTFADRATTRATLARLATGYGTTPLALAVCDAADELLQFAPGIAARKVVHLISDGEENSTPQTALCHGPPSTTRYPDLQEGSWQWKVRNMLKTGDPLRDSPNPFQLVLDVDVFFNHLTLTGSNPLAEPPAFLVFLQGVAAASGGRYTEIEDSAPAPVLGDVNNDRCVDNHDYNFVLKYYGLPVPPASPLADFNRDAMVDYDDYSVILQNWGRGCAWLGSQPPSELPIRPVEERIPPARE
jgi:hypothetical protein